MNNTQAAHPPAANYSAPHFPSLYIPNYPLDDGVYLYYQQDIWRYTVFWTLIVYAVFFLGASSYAALIQGRNWKGGIFVVLIYAVVGAIEAFLAGSIVGLILATIYEVGNFRMTTWIPLIWAVINVLVLILSTFSIQGGL